METRVIFGQRGLDIVLKLFCKSAIEGRVFPQSLKIQMKRNAKTHFIEWEAVYTISTCGNLWKIVKTEIGNSHTDFVWFSKSGKIKITALPPKHWKG